VADIPAGVPLDGKKGRKSLAGAAMLLSISLMATLWTLPFFIW
jgi:hypothetical protein